MYDESEYERVRRIVEQRINARSEFLTHVGVFIALNAAGWFAWRSGRIDFGWDLPWPVLISLPWLAGLLAHWVDVTRKSIHRPEEIASKLQREMELLYGEDWQHIADPDVVKRVEKAIRQRTNQRAEFIQHLLVFVPVNAWFWLLWQNGLTLGLAFPWVVPLMLLWMVGLVIHGLQTVFQTDEVRVQREVQREMARMLGKGVKAKRRLEADEPESDDNLRDEDEMLLTGDTR